MPATGPSLLRRLRAALAVLATCAGCTGGSPAGSTSAWGGFDNGAEVSAGSEATGATGFEEPTGRSSSSGDVEPPGETGTTITSDDGDETIDPGAQTLGDETSGSDASSSVGETTDTGGLATDDGGDGSEGGQRPPPPHRPDVPPAWMCLLPWYGDGDCDCGCGAFDELDCEDMTLESCTYCDMGCSDQECAGNRQLDADDNAVCTASPGGPGTWACDPTWWGDAWCDCGCGAFDALDCADASLSSCEFCEFGCSDQECGNNLEIDPDDNSTCL